MDYLPILLPIIKINNTSVTVSKTGPGAGACASDAVTDLYVGNT